MMFIKKITKVILLLILMPLASYGFETKAKYALLIDYDTDSVLFEKDANIPLYPSSMTKLMTIYVVFDQIKHHNLKLEDKFIISENSWKKKGSKMFVKLGDYISVKDLLIGAIVQSGNDACIALAEGISGSEEDFATLMNKKAKDIGLKDSHFANATGWPDPSHVMSSHDLAILSKRLIAEYPEYYHYFSIHDFTFNGIKQDNRNMLLKRNFGVDGLKTGHTDIAGYGIAVSAKQGNRRLILVINGLDSTIERANEAERILKYGFLNFDNITIAKKNQIVDNAKVWMGKEKTIPLIASQDIVVTLPKEQIPQVKISVEHDHPIKAPIHIGDKIASIVIEIPGSENMIYPLYSTKEINSLPYLSRIFTNIGHMFSSDRH